MRDLDFSVSAKRFFLLIVLRGTGAMSEYRSGALTVLFPLLSILILSFTQVTRFS